MKEPSAGEREGEPSHEENKSMTEFTASDDAEPQTLASPDERPMAKPKSGRALAALALLIALLAAAGAGYVFWQWWQAEQEAAANDWQGALATALDETAQARTAADTARAELQRALDELRERDSEVAKLLAESTRQREALANALASQTGAAKTAPGTWRVAEAEYLLRIANHRLLMERDASGARHLLQLADDILREAEDFAFHDVRALLAEEITTLAQFADADVQGVFLRLEAVKGSLGQLPLRLPEYIAATGESNEQTAAVSPPAPPAEPTSMWATLAQRLTGLVRFRQHQRDARRPLLPPEQADYLHMNLRLALDRAQLAALRHDAEVFRVSLTEAREWLATFVDARGPAATNMAAELNDLLQTNLAGELPDISRSLARLRQLRTQTAVADAAE